jgi:hypothetical protein
VHGNRYGYQEPDVGYYIWKVCWYMSMHARTHRVTQLTVQRHLGLVVYEDKREEVPKVVSESFRIVPESPKWFWKCPEWSRECPEGSETYMKDNGRFRNILECSGSFQNMGPPCRMGQGSPMGWPHQGGGRPSPSWTLTPPPPHTWFGKRGLHLES